MGKGASAQKQVKQQVLVLVQVLLQSCSINEHNHSQRRGFLCDGLSANENTGSEVQTTNI